MNILRWDQRVNWASTEPASKLVVGAMKDEIKELRSILLEKSKVLPDGWIALNMVFNDDADSAETVAYGPPEMMARLGKQLDKYYADVIAKRDAHIDSHASAAPAASVPDAADVRCRFERWASTVWKYNLTPARDESRDSYMSSETGTAWMAWEAAFESQQEGSEAGNG